MAVGRFFQVGREEVLTAGRELPEGIISGERELEEIGAVSGIYPMQVTRYYAGLIERGNPECPIKKQCIPDIRELDARLGFEKDPLGEAAGACGLLLAAGIPIGNQTVLMRGINDDIDTMEQLMTGLIRIRVRPYYLYQLDRVKGTEHFYVPYEKGMEIVEELQRRASGYGVPRFVIDVPGPEGERLWWRKTIF